MLASPAEGTKFAAMHQTRSLGSKYTKMRVRPPIPIRHKWYIIKNLNSLGYISLAECKITQTTWPLRRSRSFKVTDFGTNRKTICDFLSCAVSISYGRLLVDFSLSIEGCLTLTLPLWTRWEWSPANIRISFTSPETRGIVIPDAENRTIVSSFIWKQYRHVTDGRTDGSGLASTAVCTASS